MAMVVAASASKRYPTTAANLLSVDRQRIACGVKTVRYNRSYGIVVTRDPVVRRTSLPCASPGMEIDLSGSPGPPRTRAFTPRPDCHRGSAGLLAFGRRAVSTAPADPGSIHSGATRKLRKIRRLLKAPLPRRC